MASAILCPSEVIHKLLYGTQREAEWLIARDVFWQALPRAVTPGVSCASGAQRVVPRKGGLVRVFIAGYRVSPSLSESLSKAG